MKKRSVLQLTLSALLAVAMTGCGKLAAFAEAPFTGQTVMPEGVSIQVISAKPDAITYTICNTSKTPLYYEGHWFAELQGEKEGQWCPLKFANFATTADFQVAQVPETPEAHTLSVQQFYGGKLKAGKYRLLAQCYPTIEALENADAETCLCLAKEFTVK